MNRKWLKAGVALIAAIAIGGGAGGIAAAATPVEPTPTGSKQVTDTGINTYDLTLSVEGHDWSNHEPTDILFILDRTGSVGQDRWDKVRTAVEDTSERLIDAGDGNTRIAVGTFTGGYGKGEEVQVALTNSPDWAKFDATSLSTNAVEGGGTSWVEGTQIGSKLMDMSLERHHEACRVLQRRRTKQGGRVLNPPITPRCRVSGTSFPIRTLT